MHMQLFDAGEDDVYETIGTIKMRIFPTERRDALRHRVMLSVKTRILAEGSGREGGKRRRGKEGRRERGKGGETSSERTEENSSLHATTGERVISSRRMKKDCT